MYKLLASIYFLLCAVSQGYAQEVDPALRPFVLSSTTVGVFSKQGAHAQKLFSDYVLQTDAPIPAGVVIRRRLSAKSFIVSVYNASAIKILQDKAVWFLPA